MIKKEIPLWSLFFKKRNRLRKFFKIKARMFISLGIGDINYILVSLSLIHI